MKKRVLIIGWDCAAPELVFEAFKDDMPNTHRLMQAGIYGELESTVPPITVPAWMCMMTSRDPGELGIYGFRNRSDYSYDALTIANAHAVEVPALWELLGQAQKRSVVLGVPLTYPAKPFPGWMVTSFLTPGDLNSPLTQHNLQWTFPPRLTREIAQIAPDYMIDIPNFRTDKRAELEQQLIKMTRERFKFARYLLAEKAWDFFVMVEMGSDRLHHAYWRFWDKTHPKYEPNSPFAGTMRNYYRTLDEELGWMLARVDDDTTVMVVSDHGAKRMDGGICVNEWLQKHGYLTLKTEPRGITRWTTDMVDWQHTKAWGEGGYYARIFINVAGREPDGIVRPQDYESVRDKLKAQLESIVDESGQNINTRVFKPEEVYRECHNIAPDLIVYFGDLYWRSVGSVGYNSIYTYENDTGPDDCNHAEMGMFILKDGKQPRGLVPTKSIYDIAPTVLNEFGIDIPDAMRGQSIYVSNI
ncbi:alkaline phosphatase family protein [Candidatus Poribacteria bacterium]|nr:alkaline phosphatase family protein [Candidatus Poribacteria bacterium]